MFGFALKHVQGATFSQEIEQLLSAMEAEPVIGMAEVDKFKRDAAAVVERMGASLAKHEVQLKYTDKYTVMLAMHNFAAEAEFRLAACLKRLAVWYSKGLPPFPWERLLFESKSAIVTKVTEEVLRPMLLARSLAADMCKCEEDAGLKDVVRVFEKRSHELFSFDTSFRIELWFLSNSVADALDAKVLEKALSELPNNSSNISLSACIGGLVALQQSDGFKLASGHVHDQVASLIDVLAKLQRNVSPRMDQVAAGDKFLKEAIAKFQFFVVHPPANEAAPTTGRLSGAAALKAKLNLTRQRMKDDKAEVTFKDLGDLPGVPVVVGRCREG